MGSSSILSLAKSRGGVSSSAALVRQTRVMVVDDSLIIRTVLARIIGQQPDLEVVSKSSSAELALKELAKIEVDVILLDLEMPGMGGLGALPKILTSAPKHSHGIKVRLTSGEVGRVKEIIDTNPFS